MSPPIMPPGEPRACPLSITYSLWSTGPSVACSSLLGPLTSACSFWGLRPTHATITSHGVCSQCTYPLSPMSMGNTCSLRQHRHPPHLSTPLPPPPHGVRRSSLRLPQCYCLRHLRSTYGPLLSHSIAGCPHSCPSSQDELGTHMTWPHNNAHCITRQFP